MDPEDTGGGGSGGSSGAPPPPPITVTARGTVNNKVSSTSQTMSVTIGATGNALMVSIASDASIGTVSSVTWGATSLTKIQELAGANLNLDQWIATSLTAGTQTLTVSFSGATIQKAIAASEIAGLKASPIDQFTAGQGSSLNPDSGATPTTTQASEIWFGTGSIEGPIGDLAGTWQNSFTTGQRDGTTGGTPQSNATVQEGYLIVSTTGAARAQIQLSTSRGWECAICTLKGQ
jgi:hypothetical protein